jgi:hypothetical protein
MNKRDFKINYDLRPYLPDIFIKSNIYNSNDLINNNTTIDINTMIFIININRPLNSQYNDPNYMLFGIKNPLAIEDYKFPSINFFNQINTNLLTEQSFEIISTTNQINDESKQILNNIGYNLLNINQDEFQYSVLYTKENITSFRYKIIYFYFNLIKYESNFVNYNKYGSSIYYDEKIYNVLIYPFYDNELINYEQTQIKYYIGESQTQTTTKKSIKNIDFDNREIIKYYEKIDYKYFENTYFTMDEKTNIETLKNYSLNIKNYVEFIENTHSKDDQIINISLNEISKMFYYSTDYNLKNQNTYTQVYLNNQHLNNNNSLSNQVNRYSYTMDKKMSNINKYDIDSKNYSSYYYTTNTFEPTLYQQTNNYNVNFYYNINESNSDIQMTKLNIFLYKILVFINPKIIDLNYLLENVSTSIIPLFDESNSLNFGKDNEKIELYIIGDIIQTKIYYINKYKIIFEFTDELDTKFSFIIILNIVFYNKSYFTILEIDKTYNTPLAFVNCTILEESLSLLPVIYSIYEKSQNDKIFFYNTLNDYINGNNLKNYYWNINYSGDDTLKTSSEIISMYNFYEVIPNIITNLKTENDEYYNNVLNVLKNKLNNYIINFINVERNYFTYTHNIDNIKKYINFVSLYDETIITQDTNIKYIEYFDYFPKISENYLYIEKNYIGKYYQVLVYPYNNINNSSFEILPSGKYIKFNFINYSSKEYPFPITEEFIKSIKSTEIISKYYYSLFIMLPLNINQDDEFQCTCDEKFINPTTYSMGIGGNSTAMYLVLTDFNGIPYRFYSDDDLENGIIFGIKLYNYTNFISEYLKLQVIPNMYMNQYMNLNEFMIFIENFNNYSDINNMLWDINKTYLHIHNFNSLNNIILYDYKRFKSNQDINLVKEQYDKFNYKTLQILYENKVQLNYLRYDIKILIYISNLYKIIKLTKKLFSYYEVVKINIMFRHFDNTYLINIIKYNSREIANLLEINYNLAITSGNFETKIYEVISKMCIIDFDITLEDINNFQSFCLYIVNYSINKIPSIMDLIDSNISEINNTYYNLYNQIFEQIIIEKINYLVEEQVIYDIDNLINNANINILDSIFYNFDVIKKKLLLNQIGAYLKLIAFNSTKIDELFNLAKLMADNEINPALPINLDSKVVKNYYIYNTTCYTTNTNIPIFKIVNFLNDTIIYIEKQSDTNNNDNYEIFQKSISQGIITFITNTIYYFKEIIYKIVGIYIYLKNLPGIGINIYDSTEIGNFYYVLNLFRNNYLEFFQILFDNKIDVFYEYKNLEIMFNNLLYSCEEFLLYICLKKDFTNAEILFLSENIFINEDLYKIIKTDEFYNFLVKTIENFDSLIIYKNCQTTILYLEKIKSILLNNFMDFLNLKMINVIDEILLKLQENIFLGIQTNDYLNFYSYYIIPYQDLLMLKGSFNWASFNFQQSVIDVIKNVNTLNISIYTTYYENPEITDFYKQALNYTYIESPYKYININDTNIVSL